MKSLALEIVHANLLDFAVIEAQLSGFDACFFCLGISSSGMSEDDYVRVTYDITLAAARTLLRLNPAMIFVYVSGAGTDSSLAAPLLPVLRAWLPNWVTSTVLKGRAMLNLVRQGYSKTILETRDIRIVARA